MEKGAVAVAPLTATIVFTVPDAPVQLIVTVTVEPSPLRTTRPDVWGPVYG
jgi:hypothetical protein